jgi:hypothetical protein
MIYEKVDGIPNLLVLATAFATSTGNHHTRRGGAASMRDLEHGAGVGLSQMAAKQRPIPKWEVSRRPQILLCLAVAACLLLSAVITYSRLCPCFGPAASISLLERP